MSDHIYARKSKVENIGEDIPASARHKANAWRGAQSGREMLTRANLMKHEPHGLLELSHQNPQTAVWMHHALSMFPTKIGDAGDPEHYVNAWRRLKGTAENATKELKSPTDALSALHKESQGVLEDLRGVAKGMSREDAATKLLPLWNGLVRMHNQWRGSPRKSTSLAHKVAGYVNGDHSAQDEIQGKGPKTKSDKVRKPEIDERKFYASQPERVGGETGDLSKLGLRAVQWGNTVPDKERMHHLGHLRDALYDLADVMGVPKEHIGMGGQIAVGVGSRGRANSSATYHPAHKFINLNRSGGTGALAHEYGHAISWHNGRIMHPDARAVREAMTSSGFENRLYDVLRQKVRDGHMTRDKAQKYWASPEEMFARVFERHVQRKLGTMGRKNTYLSGLASGDGLWPTDEEVDKMAPAVDAYVQKHFTKYHG